jgi:tetratricopeptide (TPR) repeat protein
MRKKVNRKLITRAIPAVLFGILFTAFSNASVVAQPFFLAQEKPAAENPEGHSGQSRENRLEFPERLDEFYNLLFESELHRYEAFTDKDNREKYLELAIKNLESAARLAPDSGYVPALIADRMTEMGRVEEARDMARRALRKDETMALAWRILGEIALAEKRVEEAVGYLEKAREYEADSKVVLMHLSRIYQAAGMYEKANECLYRLAHLIPERMADYYLRIAENWKEAEQYDKAIEYYERLLRMAPFYTPAYKRIAQIYIQQEKYEEAILRLEQLFDTEENPQKKADVQMLLAQAYDEVGQVDRAQDSYESVLRYDSTRSMARRRLGILSYYDGDYRQSVEYLARYLKGFPEDWEAHSNIGMAYVELGQHEKAIEHLNLLREAGKAGIQTYAVLAQLYEETGRPDQVESVLEEALKSEENPEGFSFYLGVFQYNQGNFEQAEQNLLKVLEINPDHKEARLYLGLIYDHQDRLDELEAMMKEAIRRHEDFAEAYNLLGYSFAENNIRLEEAEQLVKKALELRPDAGFIVDSLGWVYYQQGRYAEAVQQLSRAVELMGKNPDWVVLDHLADAYLANGQNEEALEALTRAGEILKKSIEAGIKRPENQVEELERIEDKIEQVSRPN